MRKYFYFKEHDVPTFSTIDFDWNIKICVRSTLFKWPISYLDVWYLHNEYDC